MINQNSAQAMPDLSESPITMVDGTNSQKPVANAEPKKKEPSQKQRLIQALENAEVWHDKDNEAFATVETTTGKDNLRIRSRKFKLWLIGEFMKNAPGAPGRQAIDETLSAAEAVAIYEGGLKEVALRVAEDNGRIYIDLADGQGSVIACTKDGWKIADEAECSKRFFRPAGTLALPKPVSPLIGNQKNIVERLAALLNLKNRADAILVMSWLVSALNPHGPFFILSYRGEQGSGKSYASKKTREIIDPNSVLTSRPPKNEDDLLVDADTNWVVAHDNQSKLADEMSDARCRLATGAGIKKRKLFTDGDLAVISAMRPQLDNSIEDGAIREDLKSRTIFIHLPSLDSEGRRTEAELNAEFQELHPQLLGILANGVCSALRNKDAVSKSLKHKPRMADACLWATAAETALTLEEGAFMQAYEQSRKLSHAEHVENSTLAQSLIEMLATYGGEIKKTSAELLILLRRPEGHNDFPRTARGMTTALTRLAPALRDIGYLIEYCRSNDSRYWHIRSKEKEASLASRIAESQA